MNYIKITLSAGPQLVPRTVNTCHQQLYNNMSTSIALPGLDLDSARSRTCIERPEACGEAWTCEAVQGIHAEAVQ